MATIKTDTICNIRGYYDDWRVIGTRFDGLVFRKFLCENCYTLFLTLVQLELARPNYINRKIETFERFLVMQKALVKFKQRKIQRH